VAGLFIDIVVSDAVQSDAALAKKLEDVCPVNIFRASDVGVAIDESNLDECVLCDLCTEAAPGGGVRIVKLYEA